MRKKRTIICDPTLDQLKQIALEMAAQGGVKSVILFGSRARGDHKPASDADILILTSDPTKDPTEESIRIELGLDKVISCDIVAIHENEWPTLQKEPFSIFKKAKEEGVVLYGSK